MLLNKTFVLSSFHFLRGLNLIYFKRSDLIAEGKTKDSVLSSSKHCLTLM
jgi:hypothetical protein